MNFFILGAACLMCIVRGATEREWYAYQMSTPNHTYTKQRSTCFDLCLAEWKISHYGGRPIKALACANQCD